MTWDVSTATVAEARQHEEVALPAATAEDDINAATAPPWQDEGASAATEGSMAAGPVVGLDDDDGHGEGELAQARGVEHGGGGALAVARAPGTAAWTAPHWPDTYEGTV